MWLRRILTQFFSFNKTLVCSVWHCKKLPYQRHVLLTFRNVIEKTEFMTCCVLEIFINSASQLMCAWFIPDRNIFHPNAHDEKYIILFTSCDSMFRLAFTSTISTHHPLDKMADIFTNNIVRCISENGNYHILIEIGLKLASNCLIDNKTGLFKIRRWVKRARSITIMLHLVQRYLTGQ